MTAVRNELGTYYWSRGTAERLSDHFTTTEFECPCGCFTQQISQELVTKLEAVRVELAKPIRITSGYRCSEYQQTLRARGYETAVGISQHELGKAADLQAPVMAELVPICDRTFKAMGVANSFIHVDLRGPEKRFWRYKNS